VQASCGRTCRVQLVERRTFFFLVFGDGKFAQLHCRDVGF
jgi:hypothetical protein